MNHETKAAWREWCARQPATHLVTLATNTVEVPADASEIAKLIDHSGDKAEEWYKRILRKLLGNQFTKAQSAAYDPCARKRPSKHPLARHSLAKAAPIRSI